MELNELFKYELLIGHFSRFIYKIIRFDSMEFQAGVVGSCVITAIVFWSAIEFGMVTSSPFLVTMCKKKNEMLTSFPSTK